MSDYIRYRPDYRRSYENKEGDMNYETHSRDRWGRPYGDDVNTGYSSYGAHDENPYRDTRYSGDPYAGNFSGSNYDRDFDFGPNRRGRQQYYGAYNSLDYDDIDRRHDWHPQRRMDWRDSPGNLGVGSNYAYNRGGYGSNFGGEYGHFPQSEQQQRGYSNPYRGWGYGNPEPEYSSYSGRFDRNYERAWERDNRDWWDKTRDEVASWFGNEAAEHRRRVDSYRGWHSGRGPKGYQRSDTRIEEDINDRLSEDGWVDASDVEVNVQNGEVILGGSVPDRFSKRRAEDIAESVSGVRNVENRIHSNSGSPGEPTTFSEGGTRPAL